MQPSQTAQHAAPIAHAPEKHPAVHEPQPSPVATAVEKMIVWVGSITSLVLHSLAFIVFFAVAALHWVGWDTMFLVLTTVVSLEAIYLSIFIQFSVNRQAASLKEVEEDVESIQEDVEELGESVEDIQVDMEELGEHVESIKEEIEEISEDESEEAAEERRKQMQAETLEALTRDVKALLAQIESLKRH
jgi:uncharacterized membrane protein